MEKEIKNQENEKLKEDNKNKNQTKKVEATKDKTTNKDDSKSKKTELEELKEKIIVLEQENEKLKNDYAKAYADTENTRKRLNNEFDQLKKYRIQSFALDVLPALDNLERALSQESNDIDSFKKGIEMVYQQLIHSLSKEGVEEIESLNLEFDPHFHQALTTEKVEGVKENEVLEVFQKGYKIKDRILRAAMVKVSE